MLGHICSDIGATCVVLSLDLRAGRLVCPLGSPMASDSIEDVAANAWGVGISTMIVLDLSRVGGSDGPAIREIGRVRRAAPQATVYAGGGIRSVGDLKDLQAAGVTGALIATSLHDGRLTPANLHPILTR